VRAPDVKPFNDTEKKPERRGLPWVFKTSASLLCKAGVLLWPLLLLSLWLPQNWNRTDDLRDTPIYYDALRRVLEGLPLYQPWPGYGPDQFLDRYFYPPPFAAFFAPLGQLSPQVFSNLWYLLLLAAFWIYAWCLARLACRRVSAFKVLAAGLLLWLFPFGRLALTYGNAEPFVWALFGLALTSNAKGRGIALSIAALIKIHPLLTLLVAWRREGKAVALPAAITLAAGFLLSVLVFGIGAYRGWWAAVPPVVGQGSFNHANFSLSFAGLRLARELGWQYHGGPLPAAARLYLTVMGFAGPGVAVYLSRKWRPKLQYAFVANAAILFAPLCWHMYLPLLLTPAAIYFKEWSARRDASPLASPGVLPA
jgi:hypothetical protein